MKSSLKDKIKLFLVLEGILIPGVCILAFIVSLIKGSSFLDYLYMFYYGVGVIVLVTAIPSLYRRPYVEKGMYRKFMGNMNSLGSKGFEEGDVENNSYKDKDPFATGLFIILIGLVLIGIGFGVERVFV
ncbi:MAG: hypothetical protein RR645_03485 [Clostridium sp.]